MSVAKGNIGWWDDKEMKHMADYSEMRAWWQKDETYLTEITKRWQSRCDLLKGDQGGTEVDNKLQVWHRGKDRQKVTEQTKDD